MKNKLTLKVVSWLIGISALFASLASGVLQLQTPIKLSGVSGQAWIVNKKLNNVASTSPKYITRRATTTIESSISTIDADALNVKVQVLASTTGNINFIFEGSDNGIDWYDMTCLGSTIANNNRTYNSPCIHTFSMATSGLTVASNYVRRSFIIEPIIFEKMRVKVNSAASSSVWTNIGVRQPQN